MPAHDRGVGRRQRAHGPLRRPAPVAALLLLLATTVHAGPRFTGEDIIDWSPHSFSGTTDYELAETDAGTTVHARCDGGTASGLVHRATIDLAETPIIEWRWRVADTYDDIDETERAGDDYPARLYVVDENSVLRWRSRALNYVWASGDAAGSDWPNAYTEQAHIVALRDADDVDGEWRTETRDLRADFARFHDRDVDEVDAVAIMTDCDDTGQRGEAWYGSIEFRAD